MTGWRPPLLRAITRRRAISILAVSAGAALLPGGGAAKSHMFEWTGVALGADARIVFSTGDRERAKAAIDAAVAEISRLEAIFALYDENSELARLNRTKALAAPSQDMRRLMVLCQKAHRATGGLFDPTIQRLWRFYFDWFSTGRRDMPPQDALAGLVAQIGFQRVKVDDFGVQLPPDVELSFNGVAQGYITDRVADTLRGLGWRHVLTDIGEVRALDGREDGAPWRVKIREGNAEAALRNSALAVSAGDSLILSAANGLTHILDPATGLSLNHWKYIAVEHPSAAVADALSTGLFLARAGQIESAAALFSPVTVRAEDGGGRAFLHTA